MRKHLQIIFQSTVLLVCLTMSQVQGQNLPSGLSGRLQFVLDSMVNSATPPYVAGMSAAINIRNVGTWSGSSGLAAAVGQGVTTAIPWSDTLSARVYSVTKSFTASIILSLVAEGRLSLDDTIAKWIDTLATNPIPTIRNNATIRHCLTHGTGHTDYVTNPLFTLDVLGNQGLKVYTPREVLAFTGQPTFPLGTNRAYASTNYILLGMVAESVTDSSISQLYRHRIINPLGLNKTYLGVEESPIGTLAMPHDNLSQLGLTPNQTVNIQNVFPFTSIVSAAWATGGIVSTAADIAKYAMHLYGGTAIPSAALDSMLKSVDSTFNAIPAANYDDYPGYGIFNNADVAPGMVGHGGSAIGYRAFMYGNPSNGVNIAILSNQQPASLNPIARALYNELPATLLGGIEDERLTQPISWIESYPNPAESQINLGMQLQRPTVVSITLYNSTGKVIDTWLKEQRIEEGYHTFSMNISRLSPGIYFYKAFSDGQVLSKKIIVR